MDRREWLEAFIELCESGAKTLEFRRRCRIKAQHLPRYVRLLPQYRAELEKLKADDAAKEAAERAERERLEAAQRAREEAARKRAQERLEEIKKKEEEDEGEGLSGDDDAEGDSETLGA